MAGEFASVIVCAQAATGVQGPCPDGLVQTAQQIFVIPAAEASFIKTFLQPFEPEVAAMFFGSAFGLTVTSWLFAWGVGQGIKLIRFS